MEEIMKTLATLILLAGTATFALGGGTSVPEIDANSAAAAIAIVSGGLLVLRARRRK